MSGGNTLQTLLIAAAVVGTGGAALAAVAPLTFAAGAAAAGFSTVAAATTTFSALAGVASAGMSIVGGIQSGQAAKFEQRQIQEQQQMVTVQAATDRAQRELKLNQILSSQTAMFAARGVMLGSGSPVTAAQDSIGQANSEQNIADLNNASREVQLSDSSKQKALEARAAQTGGFIKGATSLLTSAQSGAFGTPKTGGSGAK